MSKMVNLLSILWLLDSGNTYTATEIAKHLEVSERTVYRYMDALSMSGYPIISKTGIEGGYSLLKKSDTSLTLSAEDQFSIQMTLNILEALGLEDNNLEQFCKKISRYNSDKLQFYLNESVPIEVINKLEIINLKIIYVLSQAINDRKKAKIKYNDANINTTERIIDPYKIIYWNYNWYLVAYCNSRKDYRTFRIDRIVEFEIILQTFNICSEFNPIYFFNENLRLNTDENIEIIQVIIEGNEWAVKKIKEHWYLSNYMIDFKDNCIKFGLENSIIKNYLPNILLPYSKSITIKEPACLKDYFVSYLDEIINKHKNS